MLRNKTNENYSMRKNIKNYTSGQKPETSVGKIQKILSRFGASKIMFDYSDAGEIDSLVFALKTKGGEMPVRLPARYKQVAKAMYDKEWSRLSKTQKQQCKNTAWKNIQDWVDAQLALIETEMVVAHEVFLPYAVMGNKTVFEHYQEGNLLGSGETNENY